MVFIESFPAVLHLHRPCLSPVPYRGARSNSKTMKPTTLSIFGSIVTAGHYFNKYRAITRRWIWFVPS